MFGFQSYIRLSLKLISNPQGRQQYLSLGKKPSRQYVEPCFPHEKFVGCHLCDECMISILPNVSDKPESIL